MPCSSSAARSLGSVAAREDRRVDARVERLRRGRRAAPGSRSGPRRASRRARAPRGASAVPPLATISPAELGEAARELGEAALVEDGDQRALDQISSRPLAAAGARRRGCARAASRRVVARPGPAPAAITGPRVDALVDVVHGDAGRRDARRERVLDRMRARERRAAATGGRSRSGSGSARGTRPRAGACSRRRRRARRRAPRASRPSPRRAPRGLRSQSSSKAAVGMPAASARARARAPRRCSTRPRRSAARRRSAPAGSCPRPMTRTPITSIRPITSSPGVGSGDDRAVADPEVEDAALLLLARRPARSASAKTGGRSQESQSMLASRAVGEHALRLPKMPPPVTCASACTSARARSRAHVVEVEPCAARAGRPS